MVSLILKVNATLCSKRRRGEGGGGESEEIHSELYLFVNDEKWKEGEREWQKNVEIFLRSNTNNEKEKERGGGDLKESLFLLLSRSYLR